MRRRHLLILPLLLSLPITLVALAATLLPVSFGPYPAGYRDRSVATFFVQSHNHWFQLYFLTHPNVPRNAIRGFGFHDAGQDIEFNTVTYLSGFAYLHADYIDNTTNLVTVRGHEINVTAWLLTLLSTPITLLLAWPFLRAWARRKPRDPGAHPCPACGYDLRASPTLCPECGSPVRAATNNPHQKSPSLLSAQHQQP